MTREDMLKKSGFANKFSNHKRAMTFIEIMIAGLLMVVVFIIGWTISSSFTGVRKVRNFENAIFLANQAIEAIRAARGREIGVDGDGRKNTLLADFHSAKNQYDVENGDGFVPVVEISGIEYKRTIRVEKVPSANKDIDSGLRLVRVKVEWKSDTDGTPVVFEAVTAHCDLW
jgi:type II secretory pathway pseudopilin PulG